MEFIKNIFKKIKNFFTIHMRVARLEHVLDHYDKHVMPSLRQRIEVLEFRDEAKGEQYILSAVPNIMHPGVYGTKLWNVRFIIKNAAGMERVASVRTDELVYYRYNGELETPVINGDYIEFYKKGSLVSVYVALEGEEALAKVDLDLYKKAYPEKFESEGKWVTMSVTSVDTSDKNCVVSATDGLKEAVNDCKKTVKELKKIVGEPTKKTKNKEKTK